MILLTPPGFSPPYGLHVLRDGVLWSNRALLLRYNGVPSACAGVRLRFWLGESCGNGCLHLAPRSLRCLLLQKSLSLLNELMPALGIAEHD
jgi:hypothetical protein